MGILFAGLFWMVAFALVWPRRATVYLAWANGRLAVFCLAAGVVIWLVCR